MIFIAIEIAIEIGIDSVFRRFAAAIQPLNHLTTPLFYPSTFWYRLRRVGIKIKNMMGRFFR